MSEEQILFWKKAMFPEIAEKDKEIERLHSIIKEVREYIKYNMEKYIDYQLTIDPEEILYLLDKEN